MSDPSGYTPRVAIVTGSAKGIGCSIAHRFADDGIDVVINDLSSESQKIDEVVEEIKKKGRRAIGVVADVTKEDEVKALVDKAVSELGSVDIVRGSVIFSNHTIEILSSTLSQLQMVANAGIVKGVTFLDSKAFP